jgi:D-lactate dehydrogenase
MTIAFFSAQTYEKPFFDLATQHTDLKIKYIKAGLSAETAILAQDCEIACIFVNDHADAAALKALRELDIKLLALRCAGYNQVDLPKAKELGITVVRVPAYSPYAVAEHTIALMLTLNRHTHKAYNRVRESNFALDGLLGFDMHGKTVGLIGLGKIGVITAQILAGFGCKLLGYDMVGSEEAKAVGVTFVPLDDLLAQADIITLHCPLTPQTKHLINARSIKLVKPGVMIINTSRGALIDGAAAIEGLKNKQIGYLGMDVYEEEGDLFFRDLSEQVIQDDVFMRLSTFPNVLITGHQAFFTSNALTNIANTTIQNVLDWQDCRPFTNQVL